MGNRPRVRVVEVRAIRDGDDGVWSQDRYSYFASDTAKVTAAAGGKGMTISPALPCPRAIAGRVTPSPEVST